MHADSRTRVLLLFLGLLATRVVAQNGSERLQACVDSCERALSSGAVAEALSKSDEALRIAVSIGDSGSVSDVLLQRGRVRMVQGDFNTSLKDLQRALRISEDLRDEKRRAAALTSIGSIHFYDRDYARAQQYYLKSLEIATRQSDRASAAMLLGNIGSVLEEMGRPDSALSYHRRHLSIRRELGQGIWIPICYTNLGGCFDKLGRSDSALHYLEASLALTEADNKPTPASGHARCMLGVAQLHAGDPQRAARTCQEALRLAKAVGDLPMQEQGYRCLYQAYEALNEPAKALDMHHRYIAVRDSISGEQRAKELVRIELTYGFERQQYADSLHRLEEKLQADIAAEQRVSHERDQKRVFLFGALGVLVLAGGLWNRLRYMRRSRNLIQRERDRSEKLLLNILPGPIAEELKAKGRASAREVEGVSILFTDFHEFTRMSEQLSAHELVAEIDACFRAFDQIAARYGLEKIKTIGDAYMCAGGLPEPRPGSARDTVMAALAMQDWLKARAAACNEEGRPSFTMRAGIHTGSVVAGIVGDSKFQYDIWGDTVNTAARMESAGAVGEVNISSATHALVQDTPGLVFTPRGQVEAKGKGGLAMFYVRSE